MTEVIMGPHPQKTAKGPPNQRTSDQVIVSKIVQGVEVETDNSKKAKVDEDISYHENDEDAKCDKMKRHIYFKNDDFEFCLKF